MAIGREPHGVEVLWNPVNRRVKTRESEAPAEPPNASPRCERLPAFLRSRQGSVQRSRQGYGSAGASPSRRPLLPESQRHWA